MPQSFETIVFSILNSVIIKHLDISINLVYFLSKHYTNQFDILLIICLFAAYLFTNSITDKS